MIRMPVVLALLGVLLAGCAASGNLVPEQAQLEARKFEVPAGKSSIFIYVRAEQLFASAVLSEIYLDGDLHKKVDVYPDEDNRKYGDSLWHVFGLENASHTVRVVVLGEPYEGSKGSDIIVENLVVFR